MLGSLALNSLGGGTAARVLRNHGRARQVLSSLIHRDLTERWDRFQTGKWKPQGRRVSDGPPISLTSWRPRLPELPLTLLTLVAQVPRPARIVVWLAEADANALGTHVPGAFAPYGVHFATAPDLGPHKKWHPMATSRSERFVICDDDTFYPPDWYRRLLLEDDPHAYVGCRCHRIQRSEGGALMPYSAWSKEIPWTAAASHDVFVTGIGGAILHPRRLTSRFLDPSQFMSLCPRADDIWLKLAHLSEGIPCARTRYTHPCLNLPSSDDTGLANENVTLHGNDTQLANALSSLPLDSAQFFAASPA